MTNVNIKRLIRDIKNVTPYTPVIEAIVNSIHAIEEANIKNGEIIVTIKRSKQGNLRLDGDGLSPISDVIISDNGIGFTDVNRGSFNRVFSELKIKKGGKGFGRFSFLKCYNQVFIESFFKEDGKYLKRRFEFVAEDDIIKDEEISKSSENKTGTIISLVGLKGAAENGFNRKIKTVSRILLEKLLVYFVIDNYKCPQIIIREEETGDEIVLNDSLDKRNEIKKIKTEDFEIESKGTKEKLKFRAKIFKVYYGKSKSSINLVADHRQVTRTSLHNYIPEFKDDFYDIIENDKGEKKEKNYSIEIYVMGNYLDENVSQERGEFEFHKNNNLLEYTSEQDIERELARIAKETFPEEVKVRQEKKQKRVEKYVDEEAYWHKSYIKDLDLSTIPYDISNENLEAELQRVKFSSEIKTKKEINKIIKADKFESLEKVEELVKKISDINKSDLVHYIATRKVVLEIFKKSLEAAASGKYELEKLVHSVIYPMSSDSITTPYNEHNLWILDERLNFHKYLTSDKPLNENDERPDILIFDNIISVRGGDNAENPIVVFEFKRPMRTAYSEDEDPIKQIGKYIKKIREKKYKTPKGREIKTSENTPAFGYLVCDLTPRVMEFCKDHSLTKSPDDEGYFGFHPGYEMYIEVMSYDKLVKDAELRNKIFFKKLGI